MLNSPQGAQALVSGEGGPDQAGKDDQADGGPHIDRPADLDQQGQLDHRQNGKQQQQAPEHRDSLWLGWAGVHGVRGQLGFSILYFLTR